jgi:O-antigen biosynthesis protein WbqL
LIESLARLHIVKRFLHPFLPKYKILITRGLPRWTRTILAENYGIEEADLIDYDPTEEQILLRNAIWPSLTTDRDHFHEFTNNVITDIVTDKKFSGGLDIKRVIISRAWFRNPIMQHPDFENENEIMRIAAQEYGFCPISPETLSWTDQVRLFANADFVVGQFGSGLHNTLFCRSGTRVGVMGFRNLVQSGISALRWQEMAYITHSNEMSPFSVPVDQFRRMLDILLNRP